MPFNIGAPELIVILLLALVLLGPSRLPDVAQSLGKSIREFRKAATDVSDAASVEGKAGTPASGAPATGTAAAPNTIAGSAAPNTLGGSEASQVSGGGEETRPAA